MRAVRSKNTTPEVQVRKLLHALGFRYRLHVGTLPGTPDIVLPKHRIVIFVHGCFWHGHDCHLFTSPRTREDFWNSKIEQNRVRDQGHTEELARKGWRVLTVWECALKGRFRWHKGQLEQHLRYHIMGTENDGGILEIRHASVATGGKVADTAFPETPGA